MSNNNPTIYLAGGIAHNSFDEATKWRLKAFDILTAYKFTVLDPMRGKQADHWGDGVSYPGLSPFDIFSRDTDDINKSDALLVNLHTVRSIGTPWEMGYAWGLDKPLFVCCTGELLDHPFVIASSFFKTTTIDYAINAVIQHFAMI